MAIEKTQFEFPTPKEDEESLHIDIEEAEGREYVLEKDKEEGTEFDTEVKEEIQSSADTDEVDVEVVDDTPAADRGRVPSEAPAPVTDDELSQYSDKVKKRIQHFSKGYHDERRAKEVAEREREELKRYAKGLVTENTQLKGTVTKNQGTLIEQAKIAVGQEVAEAKRKYREAYDGGEADALVEAQEALTTAKIRMEKVNNVKIPSLQKDKDGVQVDPSASAPPPPRPRDERGEAWAKENPWFGKRDGDSLEMTALAVGLHTKLEHEGITPQRDPKTYYERIDARMRQVFPERFSRGKKKGSNVVAPATRSTAPNKITLNSTQQRVAKQLGVPLKLYAKQVAEEMRKERHGRE